MALLATCAAALMTAGCSTLHPVSVAGLRSSVGSSVPGAQGKTLADQDAIDDHVARACAAQVYSKEDCARHTNASFERRFELREELADINAGAV